MLKRALQLARSLAETRYRRRSTRRRAGWGCYEPSYCRLTIWTNVSSAKQTCRSRASASDSLKSARRSFPTRIRARVLNAALDAGINFLDTAACYGLSEELIGQSVSGRRSEFYLATKAGHVVGGYEGDEWTAQTIHDSIDRSLKRLKTDYLDLVQLHSCSVAVLERGEAVQALQDAQRAGKVRYVGYSGDNDAAAWAVRSGLFDTLQTSFNLVDQKARFDLLDAAKAGEMGVIVKRPIANSAWGAGKSPSSYADPYFERAQKMNARGPLAGRTRRPHRAGARFYARARRRRRGDRRDEDAPVHARQRRTGRAGRGAERTDGSGTAPPV